MKPKRFPQDVQHRWNSTYELLKEALPYKDLLCHFFASNDQTNSIMLQPYHWELVVKLNEVLECFNNATYLLSGVYYPTFHLLFFECCNISEALCSAYQDFALSTCISEMASKWLKYFKEIPQLNLIATVFLPNIKIDGLEKNLQAYYTNLSIFF